MRGGGVCWDMSSACVQGGLPRPLGGYQPIMEPHSPAPAWNMHQSVVPKREPMDEERNDSGINSGSDFHSSSPGSDNSHDYNPSFTATPNLNVPTTQTPYYTTPVTSQCVSQGFPVFHAMPMAFNPLTPPSSEPMVSPKPMSKPDPENNNTTLTPHASPNPNEVKTHAASGDVDDPLRRLQMSFERNHFLPTSVAALSPKTTSEHSGDDDETEEGVRQPSVNTHGKVKTFKCKQCDFVAITKMDFWDHSKSHIKTDKILTCPKCPFVTEYKHHLEYHLRNHFGSKPFKCDKCSYSCVNKSMLNSHMKSHSNVYQYRCQDCSYATKYCHSLKLHLRKYRHQPAMVLNPDGTPNPLPIIDVYGTRRGPKQKSHIKGELMNEIDMDASVSPPPPQQQQQQYPQQTPPQVNPFASFMNFASQNQLGQLSPFAYPFFSGAFGNQLLLAQQFAQKQEFDRNSESPSPQHTTHHADYDDNEDGALDLSKSEPPVRNRRKGRAFKLERPPLQEQELSDDDIVQNHEETVQVDAKLPLPVSAPAPAPAPAPGPVSVNNGLGLSADDCTCKFCRIAFGDVILYTMHMGYHGYNDPFTCNMCGEQCNDKVAFFLHIARTPHT